MGGQQVRETAESRPYKTLNNHYRYLIAPEMFQRLRVFMVEQGFYPYGNEDCLAIVVSKKGQTGWMNVRVETARVKETKRE